MSGKKRPTIAARLPSPSAEAAAFIAGGAERAPRAPAGASKRSRAPVGARDSTVRRQDGRVLKKLHVYVPAELGDELTAFCRASGREQSHVVAEALRRLFDAARQP